MAYETFTETADAVFTSSINYNTLITNTEYGKERRRNKWTSPRRTFAVQFYEATEAVMTTIRDFFTNTGNHATFQWENPNDSVTYTVRFLEDKIRISYIGYERYNIDFQFIEVL